MAAGNGTRLSPLTKIISKALLPVYDKPMIYYPLSILMQAGIKEILIITTPQDKERFIELLGDGQQLGISLNYEIEPYPKGIAQAFIIGEHFIGKESVTLILGDNIFYGNLIKSLLTKSIKEKNGATIFGYKVDNPGRFGVVEFDSDKNVISLEEKPNFPNSDYAVTGLYVYDNRVIQIAKNLLPSDRGELEITDVNKEYLKLGHLKVELLGEDISWFDTGTHKSLFEATQFIRKAEENETKKHACIEEIAFNKGFITREQLGYLAQIQINSEYGSYLMNLLD